jgi:hypothetical protein
VKMRTIFERPIDRTIDGVIKADNENDLRLEVEEYVLTNEVAQRLESFLDAYINYQGANGVWISGFFGSGKSHLLKMLALLLENREIDGIRVLKLFLPKCNDNEFLKGALRRATAIPSKSILFNIDQKADVISKTQIDALLAVFVKVFNEMRGYYGKQGHIARFERDLDSRGLFGCFRDEYRKVAGIDWETGREQALLESHNIAQAYSRIFGSSVNDAQGILDKYRAEYRVSIEDFAEEVKSYIDQQQPGFRLNFFVDEVGQYIADNVKLMTNLQTIAESLATRCNGRAWIAVTAQEDMNTVVGEMTKQQGNDFSKIQARFAIRMKLTSADVAEVIQKRLLEKNDEGKKLLEAIYNVQADSFRTYFDFPDGGLAYRNFEDQDSFVQSYPFVPYQYALFQSAIQNLSLHNAFEGKHSSVGERSMLGVFQEVVKRLGDDQLGSLPTFDLMFEGIRAALKSNIQRAILLAEDHLPNPFAVRLLKALFLVKYVKEFKPTIRNLSVLMVNGFSQDLSQLRQEVEEALNLLEQQTYIKRDGEYYEYLTDEEKDIEQEIKNTELEPNDVPDELHNIIFNHIIKNRKVRYDQNNQDYIYSQKLDDRLFGREYELAINIITPFYEKNDDISALQLQNGGRDELLVVLPPDDRLMRDSRLYKQTEKYIRHNISLTQQDSIKRILADKGMQNSTRAAQIQDRLRELLSQARLFVGGTEIDIRESDPQGRINRGFNELILRVYPNLKMLRGITLKESDIGVYLKRTAQNDLFGSDTAALSEPEQEVLAYVQGNTKRGDRTTIKTLLERFERKPYGWAYAAILCVLATLSVRGKVELKKDSEILDLDALERTLRNTGDHPNVIIEPQADFTTDEVRNLKRLYEDLFDKPPQAVDARELAKETKASLGEMINELQHLAGQKNRYPFLVCLEPILEQLKGFTGQQYTWYVTDLVRQKDTLLDIKEKTIDPIRRFMNGNQKDIYDSIDKFMREQQANFNYVTGEEARELGAVLEDPQCYLGKTIQQAKSVLGELSNKVTRQLAQERERANTIIQGLLNKLQAMDDYASLNPEQKSTIAESFNTVLATVEKQPLIAVIRDTVRQFEDYRYPELLTQISAWANPPAETADKTGKKAKKVNPPVEYVNSRSIKISFDKAWLGDEADVNRYLESMRKAFLSKIQEGKRIQV